MADGRVRREDYPTKDAMRRARDTMASKLLNLKPIEEDNAWKDEIVEAITHLSELLEELHSTVAKLTLRTDLHSKALDSTVTVMMEDGRQFKINTADHLTLSFAAHLASRGQEVDVPLRSGEVISDVRLGELAQIMKQIIPAGEDAESEPA